MGSEIDGAVMGDDYKGYVFKITGGNDKQGFAMKQGIMVNGRVRILFKKRKSPFFLVLFVCSLNWFLVYLIILNSIL